MSSDHEDAAFERYQILRQKAESDTRKAVQDWAFTNALEAMTVGQLKHLSDLAVHGINHHTRQVFEMLRGKSN